MKKLSKKKKLKIKVRRLKLWYKNVKLQFLNKELDYNDLVLDKSKMHESIQNLIDKIDSGDCGIDEVKNTLKEINAEKKYVISK